MNLGRHQISATSPIHILDARLDADCDIFTASTPAGFAVYRTHPLQLIRKRELTGGTLAAVEPAVPAEQGRAVERCAGKEVAELEFRERVRGIACRRGWLAVSLRRRVVVFQIGASVTRYGEWDTGDNPRGLLAMATAPYATLLAIAGRQVGHVQLVHLPPCPLPVSRNPPSSSPPRKPPPPRTLVRVWDAISGKLVREFRRGTDKADIYGVAFRPDEQELCVWSDKGTVHVFNLVYFESEWSYAQYRIPVQSSHISLSSTSRSAGVDLPEEERCVVGWIEAPAEDPAAPSNAKEYQLIALTYTGGWYRLSLPKLAGRAAKRASGSFKTSPLSSGSPPQPSHVSRAASIAGSSASRLDKARRGNATKTK
ncbi:hypothetical protein BJ912DRAFT_962082 [Pholiota molesta]|nr:hypothetical protein BJ912DRAFT_962082 [Pholiota molesta]